MHRRSLVLSAIVSLSALATSGGIAGAGTECLATPDRAPQDGQHWYFRTDRATQQKCWYVRGRDAETTGAIAGPARSADAGAAAAPPADARRQAAAPSERDQKALFQDFLRWYKDHREPR